MKHLTLVILCLFSLNSEAQLAYVPDDAFEAYLESNFPSCATGGIDDYVIAEGVLGGGSETHINIAGSNIMDITGIESFTNVGLIIFDNCPSLTTIDLSSVNVNNVNVLDPDNGSAQFFGGMRVLIQNCPNVTEITAPQGYIADFNVDGNMYSLVNVNFNNSNVQRGAIRGDNTQAPNWKFVDLSIIQAVELGYPNTILFGPAFECILIDNGGYFNLGTVIINGPTCVQIEDPAYAQNAFFAPLATFSTQCNNCTTNIIEVDSNVKELLKIKDLMGRETEYTPNTPLIFYYSDGTTERVFKLEE